MASTRAQRRHPGRHLADTAVLATLSPGTMSSLCAESIAATLLHDGAQPQSRFCAPHGGTIMVVSGPRVAETRSKIVDNFLTHDQFERASWLLMVDSDMVFRPDDVDALFAVADPKERPIVGGLCFAGLSPDQMYPTVYGYDRDDTGQLDVNRILDYPRDQLVKVGATGGAFLLVHRHVFEAMAQPAPKGFGTNPDGTANVYPWFAEGHVDKHGRPFGEDIAFCIRAGALGIPVHVHTGVKIGHHKAITLTEDVYDRSRS